MKLYSPAKVNLSLEVLGKRPDGYHDLETLIQAVTIFDSLVFEKSLVDGFTSTSSLLLNNHSNLVIKARDLFRQKTGYTFPVHIHLEKMIPMEAGLGGGSSNAATTLFGLNQLAGNLASNRELQEWSQELGSDVPFFFSLGTAFCRGRGEKVTNLSSVPHTFWIVKPFEGASTAQVYKNFIKPVKADRRSPYFNDLESAALLVVPSLQAFKTKLECQGFDRVMLTGSGSAFICFGGSDKPVISYAFCQKVSSISRESAGWYEPLLADY